MSPEPRLKNLKVSIFKTHYLILALSLSQILTSTNGFAFENFGYLYGAANRGLTDALEDKTPVPTPVPTQVWPPTFGESIENQKKLEENMRAISIARNKVICTNNAIAQGDKLRNFSQLSNLLSNLEFSTNEIKIIVNTARRANISVNIPIILSLIESHFVPKNYEDNKGGRGIMRISPMAYEIARQNSIKASASQDLRELGSGLID